MGATDHAFTIVGLYEIEDNDSMKHQLICVRNPWGHRINNQNTQQNEGNKKECEENYSHLQKYETWKGDWSPYSELWTEDIYKQLQITEKNVKSDNGYIWISYYDFIDYFCGIHFGYDLSHQNNYKDVRKSAGKLHFCYFCPQFLTFVNCIFFF